MAQHTCNARLDSLLAHIGLYLLCCGASMQGHHSPWVHLGAACRGQDEHCVHCTVLPVAFTARRAARTLRCSSLFTLSRAPSSFLEATWDLAQATKASDDKVPSPAACVGSTAHRICVCTVREGGCTSAEASQCSLTQHATYSSQRPRTCREQAGRWCLHALAWAQRHTCTWRPQARGRRTPSPPHPWSHCGQHQTPETAAANATRENAAANAVVWQMGGWVVCMHACTLKA